MGFILKRMTPTGIRKIKDSKTRTEFAVNKAAVGRERGVLALYASLLFLSGVAALVYQVLWVRQLGLIVGVEVYSITIAVSAFFAGLGGGSAAFGRVADRVKSPARLYAALEVAIAVSAVTTTLLLPHAGVAFVWMLAHVGLVAWVLPFLLVGVPAFAMGGTLPVAVRFATTEAASEGGVLYALNTAGGIVGALAASFVLLPWLGIRGSAMAAAVLNLTAAAVAMVADRKNTGRVDAGLAPRAEVRSRTALALYAVAGGVALGYEVVWSQAIGQFVSTRAFSFSIVLAVYLAGLTVGSWLGARFALRVRDPWGVFGLLIAGAGLAAILEFSVLGPWMVEAQTVVVNAVLSATGSIAMRMYAGFAIAGLGIVFVPTMLLGAAFPMALRLIVGARYVGRDVGAVVAANTAGGIVGTLLTGFVLIPRLGLVRTLALLAIGAVMVGLIAALSGVRRAMKLAVGAMCVAVVVAAVMTPTDRLANLLLATRGGGTLVFYEEGRGSTVAIAQQRSKDNVFRRLFIQGASNSGDAMPSMRYMRLQAVLPLLVHDGEPKSVMVVGFGTGITAGETLRFPALERRVCVELLPAVVRSGQMFPENYKAWSDPKMQIRLHDGRQELMLNGEQYDVITLESPPPSAQGVSNLYSTEFYELAKKRLAPKGIFAQWLPIATQNVEETRGLVRSFLDAFPYATLWTTELHEMLLMGSEAPIRIDARRMQERFSQESVAASLKGVGIDSPAAVLATWVTGREGLERFAADAKPVTDDRPRVEYGPWVRPGEITRVLPEMLALKTAVPVEAADDALRMETEQKRVVLMDFYAAGLAAYDRDEDTWRRSIARVQAAEPGNAYYAWVIGRD
jgi:spermidine synthase